MCRNARSAGIQDKVFLASVWGFFTSCSLPQRHCLVEFLRRIRPSRTIEHSARFFYSVTSSVFLVSYPEASPWLYVQHHQLLSQRTRVPNSDHPPQSSDWIKYLRPALQNLTPVVAASAVSSPRLAAHAVPQSSSLAQICLCPQASSHAFVCMYTCKQGHTWQ